jgi:hypothetical protein
VLSGASALAIATASTTYPQFVAMTIRANAANQVLDILLGCDAAGAPSMFARITFGDSSVSANDCGSIQLFDSTGTAYEDAQPVYSLVNGTTYTINLCTDAVFGRFYVVIAGRTGNSTALITSDPGGRLGLRLQNDQSGTMTIVPGGWERIWIASQTCRNCRICGTGIDGTTIGNDSVSTCLFTMSGPFYFGLNIIGMTSLEALTTISALDRMQGYGVRAFGAAYLSDTDGTSLELHTDDYQAVLTISERLPDECIPSVHRSDHHLNLVLELFKSGVSQGSATRCVDTSWTNLELFTFSLTIIFCDGNVTARAGIADLGFPGSTTFGFTVSGTPAGGTSAHGASIGSAGYGYSNPGGVTFIDTTRCRECTYCEECDDPVPSPATRSYSVEVTGTPYDGTHVLTGTVCGASGTGGGIPWTIAVRRHNFLLTGGTGPGSFSGVSSGPLPDCDSVSEEEVPLSGSVTYGVVVATIQNGSGAQNEKQSIKFNPLSPLPTSGTFTLSHSFYTTSALAYNASNAAVQAALESLTSIGSGNVVITGTVGDWVAEFVGALALTDVSQMSHNGFNSLSTSFSGVAKITSV